MTSSTKKEFTKKKASTKVFIMIKRFIIVNHLLNWWKVIMRLISLYCKIGNRSTWASIFSRITSLYWKIRSPRFITKRLLVTDRNHYLETLISIEDQRSIWGWVWKYRLIRHLNLDQEDKLQGIKLILHTVLNNVRCLSLAMMNQNHTRRSILEIGK